MISLEYMVTIDDRSIINLVNRIGAGVKDAMQDVVDTLTDNIKGHFDDTRLAETVNGIVEMGGISGSSDIIVTGKVSSTWADMVWYENGRPPGKMPPLDKIVSWATSKGIQPDRQKSMVAFAFAINRSRQAHGKHQVPIDVLVNWQTANGIVPSEDFAIRSVAYAIGLKIAREGVAGKHFFALGLQETQPLIHSSFENVVVNTTGIR